MNKLIALLDAHSGIHDYKINHCRKEGCELFFVKGALETVRRTDNSDITVTVYVDHDGYRGHAQFPVYASTGEASLPALIDEAAARALLICNKPYELPQGEEAAFEVESNFKDISLELLAQRTADAVFAGDCLENGALNSVEVFISKRTEGVVNSHGVRCSQVRYEGMIETIPTYNAPGESVELYHSLRFSRLDPEALTEEMRKMMAQVKARYEATKPETPKQMPVVLNKLELNQLFFEIADQLDYATVYSQYSIFKIGDLIQKEGPGDPISMCMCGRAEGSAMSSAFDSDGLILGSRQIVESGRAAAYHGSNRFGQYLGEQPSGMMSCLKVETGTLDLAQLNQQPYLEILSMSGLQVDFYSDYIGGEIRLAYLHDGGSILPMTGISISGSLSEALRSIRLSGAHAVCGGYSGPEQALLDQLKIF